LRFSGRAIRFAARGGIGAAPKGAAAAGSIVSGVAKSSRRSCLGSQGARPHGRHRKLSAYEITGAPPASVSRIFRCPAELLDALARGPGARSDSRHAQAFVEEGQWLADIDNHDVWRVGVDRCRQRVRTAMAREKLRHRSQPEPPGEAFGL